MKRAIACLGVGVVLGGAATLKLLDAHLSSLLCGNEASSAAPSPDRSRKLVVFERDCGATTPFSTQVSLLPIGSSPSEAGNVFTAEDGPDAPSGDDARGPVVSVRWEGPRSAVLTYPRGSRVFRAESTLDDVTIRYELAP
jgi:hypothetical protein